MSPTEPLALANFKLELLNADNISTIRLIESQAARTYWSAWSTLPVMFPKKELSRVPEHWCSFGARVSPLTGSPRLAANPANAILNYLYAVLESEARLAASVLGLDPGLGVLHVDTPARDSLACDLMEPIRPQVDAYLLDWITRQPLSRAWFSEQLDGNCRLLASFAVQLSETAQTWGRAVAPITEWVARALWSTIPKPDAPLPTRLTQANKREAKGVAPLSRSQPAPTPESVCCSCGTSVSTGQNHCEQCGKERLRERMIEKLQKLDVSRHKLSSRESEWRRLSENMLSQDLPGNGPTFLPWLTEETYKTRIQPLLKNIANPVIMSALGVSVMYAVAIRAGAATPPRFWLTRAKILGVSGRTYFWPQARKQSRARPVGRSGDKGRAATELRRAKVCASSGRSRFPCS